METEVVTKVLPWLIWQVDAHGVVMDSQSMFHKVERGLVHQECVQLLEKSGVTRMKWIYCPGQLGVRGSVASRYDSYGQDRWAEVSG